MDIDKDIREIEAELEDEKPESPAKRFLKKTYLILIALILASLLILNSAPGYHFISLLSGRIVSSTLNEDYTFELKNSGRVVFEESVFEQLRSIYMQNQKNEFKVCLIGSKQENTYNIIDLYMPVIYDQTPHSVTAEQCNENTIIPLHSHPPMRCIFSEQDIRSYNAFKQINPDAIIGLMCEEERFTFFGY